ncbi:hypothetical protein LX32DRAFT_187837 [Colletotrichum zoysiae]|uniref:Secreted protein n=1 Tax=Colletotrichum zoysiae TaxID=1216348 RepID=A0AAD9H753_9PEZI|nr:hypothetical protein LX32DRAFT_187837 [Colletotrichum zoysiae]
MAVAAAPAKSSVWALLLATAAPSTDGAAPPLRTVAADASLLTALAPAPAPAAAPRSRKTEPAAPRRATPPAPARNSVTAAPSTAGAVALPISAVLVASLHSEPANSKIKGTKNDVFFILCFINRRSGSVLTRPLHHQRLRCGESVSSSRTTASALTFASWLASTHGTILRRHVTSVELGQRGRGSMLSNKSST